MTEQRRPTDQDIMGMTSLELAELRQARQAAERGQSRLSSPVSKKSGNEWIRGGKAIGLVLGGALAFEALTGGALFPKPASGDGGSPSYGPSAAPTLEATPRTSQAPGTPEPSLAPTSSPEASAVNITSIEVGQLVPFEVQAGDWISADVSMSDTKDGPLFPLYDSDYDYLNSPEDQKKDITRTAMGVDVQADGWVVAPYGKITIIRGMTPDQKALAIANEINLKKRGGQFDEFNVVIWKGLDETVSQAGKKFDGTLVGTNGQNPTESMTPTLEDLANLSTQEKLNVIISIFQKYDIDVNSQDGKDLLAILAACLCGCTAPTESPLPSATPTPEPTGAVCTPKMTDKVIPAGTVWHSNGVDFIIQGDVTIDGKKTYTVGDPNNDRTIDWVTDGKNHTVVFDYRSDRQLFNNCSTDAFEQLTYNSDKTADARKIDPKSIVLK